MGEKKGFRLALIGTKSLRGKEIKNVLEKKDIQIEEIRFYDSDIKEKYSRLTQFRNEAKVINPLGDDPLKGLDLVFLATEEKINRKLGRLAEQLKIRAVDLNETFVAEEDVPLVVSGVNDKEILKQKHFLVANPHPVSVVLSHTFHVVLTRYAILRAIAFILQPASAFDESGIQELANQSFNMLNAGSFSKKVFKTQAAFNLLSQVAPVDACGFSKAERQIAKETKQVLGRDDFRLSLSLVQAPVFHAYSIMTFLELEKEADIPDLEDLFRKSAYFKYLRPSRSCPVSSVAAAGKEKIYIGQIKRDESLPHSFWLWTAADNLTRGSALNAFELAKSMLSLD